jgi:hypothetical protein
MKYLAKNKNSHQLMGLTVDGPSFKKLSGAKLPNLAKEK